VFCSFPPPSPFHTPATNGSTLATVHRKKSTHNFVLHVTKVFSNKSSLEVKIKTFLVLNSNDNGTVELRDVRLILPSPAIRGSTNCAAKT